MRHAAWNILRAIVCLALLWGASGCETYGRADWKSRIGSYTYDDAVKELGPPEAKETISDGTIVAQWLIARGRIRGTSVGPSFWGSHTIDIDSSPDSYLQLTFGPDHHLAAWKRLMK